MQATMRSGRAGLSEYTTQRLEELRALRETSAAHDYSSSSASYSDQRERKSASAVRSSGDRQDEGLGTSHSDSSDGVTSSSSPDSADPKPPASRVVLPSAMLEGKRGVGYQSLALPPDGAYRPLRYGDERYEKVTRHHAGTLGSSSGAGSGFEDIRMIDPLPVVVPVAGLSEGLKAKRKEEVRRKSATYENIEGLKSLAITPDDGCIGFAKLPDQVHRKAIKRGFDLTLMVVGESGLGKSTLLSSMFFQNDLYKDRSTSGVEEKIFKTVEIQKRQIEIEEFGVRLRLTIVDTPGFNDGIDATECWKPLSRYIDDQFEQYLHDESGLNRQAIQDNRVHCCLYFISPYGRGLRPVDVDFMKRLQQRVNIVPIIAKADVLTPKELTNFKSKLMEEILQHKIQIYELPPTDNDEDEEFKRKDKEIKMAYPFAVIGGNSTIEVDGKRVQGRVYPWGIVEAENPQYSDVTLLRQFLVSTHLHDLKEVTKEVHYENFRAAMFDHKAKTLPPINTQPDASKLLREKEEEIRRMHMILQKMQSQLHSGYAR